MTTPTTQREADERAQKALAAITERLALTYRICCGTSPKQSVGELLDMTINMPEWEVVRAAIDQSASPAVCGPIRITVEHGCVTHVGYTSTTARFPDGIHELWPTPVAAPEVPAAATDQPSAGQVDSIASLKAQVRFYQRLWEQDRASLTPTAPQAASQQAEQAHLIVSTAAGADRLAVLVSVKRGDITTVVYSRYHSMNGDSVGVESISADIVAPQAATTASASATEGWQEQYDASRAQAPSRSSEKLKEGEYSEGAKAMIGAVMPCGACVTNVYEAYRAGERAALARAQGGTHE